MDFFEALNTRRSQYGITNTINISDEDIIKIVQDGIRPTPSPYNIQPTRAVILFGENHKKLWEIVKEVLLAKIGPERFVKTEKKVNTQFLAGYGTVMFFIDEKVVKEHAEKMSDLFYTWSDQSAGMAQGNVWVGLSQAGLGASLQHYNPIIDEKVKKEFNIPKEWKLISQMPFGEIIKDPKEKEFEDINKLVVVKR